jgi:hypothetical protein
MKKFKRYDEGGSVEEAMAKQRGLDMSNKEAPVGFFERLRAGNIDEPGSEAYNRFGAGRGRAAPAEAERPMPVARPPAQPNPIFAAGLEQGKRQPSGDASVAEDYSGPRTKPIVTSPVKPAASKPTASKPTAPAMPVPSLSNAGPMRGMRSDASSPQYAGPLRGMRSDAGTSPPIATHFGPRDEEKAANKMNIPKMRDDAKAALAEDPSALMPGAGAAAAAAALLARTKLGKLGKMFRGKNKSSGRDLVVSPSKGPTMGKADDDRAASAYDKLKKSSFVKKGDDVTDVTPKSKSTTMKQLGKPTSKKPLDESDTTGGAIGYKRGGKTKNYASGGMVSSASRRADGIATKGKTRCKIC